jgi:diguanylate cyclase (GGDEF)-like protein
MFHTDFNQFLLFDLSSVQISSLRQRFNLGMGAMLLPLLMLSGSLFVIFDQAIGKFEQTESERLEKIFPLAELERSFEQAEPTLTALSRSPEDLAQRSRLDTLNYQIQQILTQIHDVESTSPEERQLILSVGQAWTQTYTTIAQQQAPPPHGATKSGEGQQTGSVPAAKNWQPHLDEAVAGVRHIQDLLANLQSTDNVKQAQQLKQAMRWIIAVIFVIATSLAVHSGFRLSRSILTPMQSLLQGLNSLGEGDLSVQIELNSRDEFAQLAAAINGMATKLAQSQAALVAMATQDELTGVFNRREFNRLLSIELERSRRDRRPVSMVMVDLDHFKSINDTYGHQSGDDALQWVSALLKRELRPGDIVARYGGEEFAMILPNTSLLDAFAVADRIRQKIAAELVPIQNQQTIAVTASLGCATFPQMAHCEDQLMSAADKALYVAKESGRNRVCLAEVAPEYSSAI